jgi:hypothetical protein
MSLFTLVVLDVRLTPRLILINPVGPLEVKIVALIA